MEILKIQDDNIFLLFHSAEAAEVGEQFQIIEPGSNNGIIIQVLSNDSYQYAGIEQELMQSILEQHISETHREIDREIGLNELKNLKIAKAKIRKEVQGENWIPWSGWIPTRNVEITSVLPENLINKIFLIPSFPICFTTFNSHALQFDGQNLDKVNVITGVKGSGKSHLAKHIVISLSAMQIPCIVFDINGEYSGLPQAITLRWGDTFLPDLADLGYWVLLSIIDSLNPLPETSRNTFEHQLAYHFQRRRLWCEQTNRRFSIDIDFLLTQPWSDNELVQGAIERRLRLVNNLNLFRREIVVTRGVYSNFNEIYEQSCNGHPIIIDLRNQSLKMQKALTTAIINQLEDICQTEAQDGGRNRYPFVFFEEAHFYITESDIMNMITRGRHIGISSVFITNTPQNLPDTVFRQLDNLFLLQLTHQNDIKQVSKNSFTDEETIECFATRMLPTNALIIGKITQKYPLIVNVNCLPESVGPTGVTRSTWTRLTPVSTHANNTNSPVPPS